MKIDTPSVPNFNAYKVGWFAYYLFIILFVIIFFPLNFIYNLSYKIFILYTHQKGVWNKILS